MLRGWTTATGGSERSYPLCPPLSTAIHRKEKVAKRKEERPTTAFFFSSNDDGNDHLKSGQLWSEGLGAPQTLYQPLFGETICYKPYMIDSLLLTIIESAPLMR